MLAAEDHISGMGHLVRLVQILSHLDIIVRLASHQACDSTCGNLVNSAFRRANYGFRYRFVHILIAIAQTNT